MRSMWLTAVSYGELANADETISDEAVFAAYEFGFFLRYDKISFKFRVFPTIEKTEIRLG